MEVLVGNLIVSVDEHATIVAGDDVLCDNRNHKSDAPSYSIEKCVRVENGWIFTDKDETTGLNPLFTFKIIDTKPKGDIIDALKDLVESSKKQIKEWNTLLANSNNSGSVGDITKFTRLKACVSIEQSFVDKLEKLINIYGS